MTGMGLMLHLVAQRHVIVASQIVTAPATQLTICGALIASLAFI